VNLFVYGTLRRGAAMHGLLEGRVRYVGPARVAGRLLDLGAFPALAVAVDPGERVQGDLFAIAAATRDVLLDTLDRYEGDRFERERALVEGPSGETEAWLYRWRGDPRGRRLISGGDYLAASMPGRLR
jgi:gamma-glutamylcyclotransferase (GGCT)/AIG2-like uncharacterized protein YtfP